MGKRSRKAKNKTVDTASGINRNTNTNTKNIENGGLKNAAKDFAKNPFSEKPERNHFKQIMAAGCGMLAVGLIFYYSGHGDIDIASELPETKTEVSIGAMTGPTGMGLAKLMADDEAETTANDYEFKIAGSPTELTPLFIQGDLDMMAVPANMGSVLYSQSLDTTQVLAINTLGVLYIMENGESVNESADLVGKTIYMAGKGGTPEYTINHILDYLGIKDQVNIEFKSEHAEVLAAMLAEPGSVGMLPEPFVTTALNQSDDLRVAIDLNDSWQYIHEGNGLITGTMLVNSTFAKENPEAVADFIEEYQGSTAYANENITDAAALMEEFNILPADVAETAIPNANLVCITGEDMKTQLGDYLEILFEQDATSVGGALPDEKFYYTK